MSRQSELSSIPSELNDYYSFMVSEFTFVNGIGLKVHCATVYFAGKNNLTASLDAVL